MPHALLYSFLAILAPLLGVVGIRAMRVLGQRNPYASYWIKQNGKTSKKGAVKLVVFGDSVMQGIGASQPQNGVAGLIAEYIEQETGRPVHIANFSKWGARVDGVLKEQMPRADLASADIVVVAASANDALKRTPIEDYKQQIKKLTELLPADKSIVADVPGVKRRDAYQLVLQTALESGHFRRADLKKAFAGIKGGRGVTAADFFHPNNKGYEVWFSAFKPELDSLLPQLKSKAS